MAEEVFIEYMSQNGITDAAAHMIVLDRIRDTNPQLILNLIAENVILTGRRKDFWSIMIPFRRGCLLVWKDTMN